MNTRTQRAKNNCNGESAARPHGRLAQPVGRIALGAAVTSFVAALLVLVPSASRATQLTFLNSPLFVTVPVPSNIFFLNDDSGSMDWGLMTPQDDGIITLGTCSSIVHTYYYTHPGASGTVNAPAKNSFTWIIATEEALSAAGAASPYSGVWRAWNKDYNKIYYNPDVSYTPWQGLAVNSSSFSDASPTAAPFNPYRPGDGTLDLTANTSYSTDYCPTGGGTRINPVNVTNFYPARYYVWTDNSGGTANGVVDTDDGHTLVEIKSTTPTCASNGNVQPCLKRVYADEIKNFANWFSYHRKRDLTAKKAANNVIVQAQSEARMGLATLHNNDNNNIAVAQMNADAELNPKKALLDALFRIIPSGGTPLRTKLNETGKLFECVSGNILSLAAGSSSCPILPASQGGTCQQNFTVLMREGFWNDSFSAVGNVEALHLERA